MLGLAVLGLSASASAAPVVTLKAKAVPISGFPGTGNILGAGAAVATEFTITGTEYGGFPPPLIGVTVYLPAGTKLHPQGFVTCAPAALEKGGFKVCPKKSAAGPRGEATGRVSFGESHPEETVGVYPFFAPGGGLEFWAEGTEPVSIEILSKGHFTTASAPFGPKFVAEVPLVESVPGALDASINTIKVKVGAAYKQGKKTISYGTLPKTCPKGGFPVKSELMFLGGITSTASYKAPCPKK
ncbi:MAG TPA: hypothetical protein VFC30_09560 [Solirubrobacteraceae bacterium]|nr:hypothetical protein [Solirubrobacteraceae bacterium]